MSSSQTVNTKTVSGYPFDLSTVRNASDWIRYKKQTRVYENYNPSSTDNKQTEPVWMKYGNDIRTTYNFGRLECDNCDGNAFSGVIPSDVQLPVSLLFYPLNLMSELTDLQEVDDEVTEITATGMDFYMDGTNYGDGQNGGIFLSSNNNLMFGSNSGGNDCCQDYIGDWANSDPTVPVFSLNSGDRDSVNAYTSGVVTSGDYKFISIIQSWTDHSIGGPPLCYTQITIARNTVTNQQYVEYRVQQINPFPGENNFFMYYLPVTNSGVETEFRTTVPSAGSSFLLTGNSNGTSWTYQDGGYLSLY